MFSFLRKIFRTGERRKWKRHRLYESLYAECRLDTGESKGEFEGVELSLGDIRFASSERFRKGARLDLTLRFIGPHTEQKFLKVRARVVRCEKKFRQKRYRTACVFTEDMEEAVRHELRIFLNWLEITNMKYAHLRYGPEARM